jgi:hypothetical protein
LLIPSRNRLTDRDSSHGLCFPTAHAESKVPYAKGLPADRGYVRRVWLPSRRFAPFDALPVLFHTSSAHGIHPSELSPLERHQAVSRRKNPRTVEPRPKSARRQSKRACDPQFLGLAPFESPWRSSPCLAGQSLDAPLGFTLPGHSGRSLVGISPELLSRAWRRKRRLRNLHHRVSISPCLVHPSRNGKPKRTAEQPS